MFSLFGSKKQPVVVFIDIGSGSVGTALVHAVDGDVLYEKRTSMPLTRERSDDGVDIKQTMLAAMTELGNEGLKALQTKHSHYELVDIVCTVSQPWCHTVTRTITHKTETPVEVTSSILRELEQQAVTAEDPQYSQSAVGKRLGFDVVDSIVSQVYLNGYKIAAPYHGEATEITLVQTTILVRSDIKNTITDMIERLFPGQSYSLFSFMCVYTSVLHQLLVKTDPFCIVDVTDATTEVALVVDGVTTQAAYVPHGIHTIASRIAATQHIPLGEAYTHLETGTAAKNTDAYVIQPVLDEYTKAVQPLLHRLSEETPLPKKIFVHSDLNQTLFMQKVIEEAVYVFDNADHTVQSITPKMLKLDPTDDLALMLARLFFHIGKMNCLKPE